MMTNRATAKPFGPRGLAWPFVGPFFVRCAFLGFHFLLFAPPTYAYIDPGTGSFIVQAMIAGLLGILVSLKMYWARIKVIFNERLKFGRKAPTKHE